MRLCNFQKQVGDTTPVGRYPAGTSPYGALDMAGNVQEWTSSLWGKDEWKPEFGYPYDASDGREALEAPNTMKRVLRGGNFFSDASLVRCACRFGSIQVFPYEWIGFRVAASPLHA
jgi:iron(II)-dependent oxidoreductase